MKFGKLPDISQVNFSLPPNAPQNKQVLGGQGSPKGFRAYVGLPRWASKDWVGKLYPKGTKQADYLNHYARSFNCIELNTTHYRSPSPAQVQKWADMTPTDFHFCPKIPQAISHHRKLVQIDKELADFTESIGFFGEKLGCSFVQLHESFGPNLMGNLQQFVKKWPQKLPLAIEFRHEDWFVDQQLLPALHELLLAHQITPVITDVAGRRDVCHATLTNRTAMIRFVGNALHPTDYERTDAWLDRLETWVHQGLETLYVFAHEPGDVLASEMGSYWIAQLNARFGLELVTPGIQEDAGSQMSLF